MSDPLGANDSAEALRFIAAEAQRYLAGLAYRPVRPADADTVTASLDARLPEEGDGTMRALADLVAASDAALGSAGPRFFHWVTGGSTPAAIAADWFTSALDQNAFAYDSSPLGTRLEALSIDWLKDLFGLPPSWGGVLTTGATMANFAALAAARHWWAEAHGVDIDAHGSAGLPAVPVLSSGYIHVSATKALAMLGIGRETVRRLSRDEVGRLDLAALEGALRDLHGAPAIVVGNAGEVNAGDFDPLEPMADLCERYGAWLHVDGAFGLFAAVSPRTAGLLRGLERAQSAIADGHKWLNVPYDCGFAFVREERYLHGPFAFSAAYLPPPGRPSYGNVGPEASRRARGIAVWATLRAYGRSGYREMVERHLSLAQRIAKRVDAAPELERLAEVPLNIICFRYRAGLLDDTALDDLNARIGAAILADGRVYVGTTRYGGRTAFRPAISNWRTTDADVDLLVDIVLEIGAREAARS